MITGFLSSRRTQARWGAACARSEGWGSARGRSTATCPSFGSIPAAMLCSKQPGGLIYSKPVCSEPSCSAPPWSWRR